MSNSGYVYFIRCGDFVKVGFSHQPEARLRELQLTNPLDLYLVAMHEGTMLDEQRLHRYFRAWHHRLEWFHWCADIERIANNGLPQLISGKRVDLRIAAMQREPRSPFSFRRHCGMRITRKYVKGLPTAFTPAIPQAIMRDPQAGHIMNKVNPEEHLTAFLAQHRIEDRRAFAKRANVSLRQVSNAIGGRPVSTIAYMRIAAVAGFDPMPEFPHDSVMAGDFDFPLFALAFAARRRQNNHNERTAAKATGVSLATISRLENGHTLFVGVVIRACRYLDAHPFSYLKQTPEHAPVAAVSAPVSRESLIGDPPPVLAPA